MRAAQVNKQLLQVYSQHRAALSVPARDQQRHAKGPAHAHLPLLILAEPQRKVAQTLWGRRAVQRVSSHEMTSFRMDHFGGGSIEEGTKQVTVQHRIGCA